MPSRGNHNRENGLALFTNSPPLNPERHQGRASLRASSFWAKHMQKMVSLGIHDRRWILFALDDIATFCASNRMKLSSDVIEFAIRDLEETVLANK